MIAVGTLFSSARSRVSGAMITRFGSVRSPMESGSNRDGIGLFSGRRDRDNLVQISIPCGIEIDFETQGVWEFSIYDQARFGVKITLPLKAAAWAIASENCSRPYAATTGAVSAPDVTNAVK